MSPLELDLARQRVEDALHEVERLIADAEAAYELVASGFIDDHHDEEK